MSTKCCVATHISFIYRFSLRHIYYLQPSHNSSHLNPMFSDDHPQGLVVQHSRPGLKGPLDKEWKRGGK